MKFCATLTEDQVSVDKCEQEVYQKILSWLIRTSVSASIYYPFIHLWECFFVLMHALFFCESLQRQTSFWLAWQKTNSSPLSATPMTAQWDAAGWQTGGHGKQNNRISVSSPGDSVNILKLPERSWVLVVFHNLKEIGNHWSEVFKPSKIWNLRLCSLSRSMYR